MKRIFAFFTLLLLFGAALISSCSKSGFSSYKFDFPIIDITKNEGESESVKTEVRKLPDNPVQGTVKMYVEELLLGPESPRLQPIFSLDSSLDFCFVRNDSGKDVLYLGISESSVYNLSADVDIQGRVGILKDNIKKNFKDIEEIVLFIGDNFVNE